MDSDQSGSAKSSIPARTFRSKGPDEGFLQDIVHLDPGTDLKPRPTLDCGAQPTLKPRQKTVERRSVAGLRVVDKGDGSFFGFHQCIHFTP